MLHESVAVGFCYSSELKEVGKWRLSAQDGLLLNAASQIMI